MFAKLLPTKIADRSLSGLLSNSKALFADLSPFFEIFFNLTLFEAIIPVSEPEKNPESIKSNINTISKNNNEGSSSIKLLY